MISPRVTPSMQMLTAFEAAARHHSFTQAARDLHVTQSAVSRQIQALEAQLGVALFQRRGRRIRLTELGLLYAREVTAALGRIRGAGARVMAHRAGEVTLNLAVLPTFATRWLLPRLIDFEKAHPGIVIHLHARAGQYDLTEAGFDAAINVGFEPWPGLVSHPLAAEEVVLAIAPDLQARQPIRDVADVAGHRLLLIAARAEAWHDWFRLHGLPTRAMKHGAQFEFTEHLIRSLCAGLGIGLVSRSLIADELADGRLLVPIDAPLPGGRRYLLLYPPEKQHFPALAVFRDWLLQTLDDDGAPR